MQRGSLVGLGGKEEACLEQTALERGRVGAAVENALFLWGTMLRGWVLVKSEVGGGGLGAALQGTAKNCSSGLPLQPGALCGWGCLGTALLTHAGQSWPKSFLP